MSAFTLLATDDGARAGILHTAHGDVPTPAFMPVATLGSVRTLDPSDLRGIGASIVLGNTYHLYLRPGVDLVSELGGLHQFMAWPGPVLTDSGGFQGFSLAHLRDFDDDGILFKSHIDGSMHKFTPESAIASRETTLLELDTRAMSHLLEDRPWLTHRLTRAILGGYAARMDALLEHAGT